MSHVLKTILYGVLGLCAGVLLVAVSPLVLAYFLFDRLCGLIEEFKPARSRKRKRRGGWMKQVPLLLKLSSGNAYSDNQKGRQNASQP